MEAINGKVNNSNKMKTYAEGNNNYISPSSSSYLGNIKSEVETIDFDINEETQNEEVEEKVTPIKYSEHVWDSKENLVLYFNSNGFNIEVESIESYSHSVISGISFGSVTINGKRYLVNSNGIEKSFDVEYNYDNEGEYAFNLNDIMYSKDTLATFLISKNIISDVSEISSFYNNGDNTGIFFLKDGHFAEIYSDHITEEEYNVNDIVVVNDIFFDHGKLIAYLQHSGVISSEDEILSTDYLNNSKEITLKDGSMYCLTNNGLEKCFNMWFSVDSFDESDENAFKLDDIMYSKNTLATFLIGKGIIQNVDEIAAFNNNGNNNGGFYLKNGRYFDIKSIENPDVVTITENLNLRNNYISLMDKNGIYSYNNYPIHEYGGNQCNLSAIDDDNVYKLLQNDYIVSKLKKIYPDATMEDYEAYLSKISSIGCGYTALANCIFKSFENMPAEFEKKFGYPMYYTDESGNKIMNYENLIFDYFTYVWADGSGYSIDQIVNGPQTSENVPNYNGRAQIDAEGAHGTSPDMLKVFSEFMEKNYNLKVDIDYKDGIANDELVEKVKAIKQKNDMPIIWADGYNLNYLNGNNCLYDGGSHAMCVTNVTPDNEIIVSTWGDPYIIDVSDVDKNVNEDNYISLLDVDVHMPYIAPKSKEALKQEFITGFENQLNHRNNINLGE